jgi:pimeloyl-ACP methyl ester carboxylesterase
VLASAFVLFLPMMSSLPALAPRRLNAAASQKIKSYNNIRCCCCSSSATARPKLAYEWITNGQVVSPSHKSQEDNKQTIVFLHGLLGNSKNLRTPAKKLTRQLPHVSALLLDVRGHGSSTCHARPHNFASCVQDIFDTLSPLGLIGEKSPNFVVGHSLGGRIALQYTWQTMQQQQKQHVYDIKSPSQTWILDSVPGTPDPSVHNVLKAISSIPLPISCKSTLTETLINKHKLNKSTAMWIASNLKGDRNDFSWVFDLDVANELVDNFADQNFAEMIHQITDRNSNNNTIADSTTIHLIMAGQNKEWKVDIISELQSIPTYGESKDSLFRMHKIEKAGHWVHVDAVNELTQLMVDELLHAHV